MMGGMGGPASPGNPQENEDTLTNESLTAETPEPSINPNDTAPQQPSNPLGGMFPGMQGMDFNNIMNAYALNSI